MNSRDISTQRSSNIIQQAGDRAVIQIDLNSLPNFMGSFYWNGEKYFMMPKVNFPLCTFTCAATDNNANNDSSDNVDRMAILLVITSE